jgi:hypothetical protein
MILLSTREVPSEASGVLGHSKEPLTAASATRDLVNRRSLVQSEGVACSSCCAIWEFNVQSQMAEQELHPT